MARPLVAAPEDIRLRVARRLGDYRVTRGPGEVGTLAIGLERNIVRAFRAHWTGFKLTFPKSTLLLTASLNSGEYWSEGYISIHQPSWVLAFRKDPHKSRGSGGPRPDDKLSLEASVEVSLAHRRALIEAGELRQEELIRMADYNDPIEAVDEFFNYTSWYVLRAIESSWDHLGYLPDNTMGWGLREDEIAATPKDVADAADAERAAAASPAPAPGRVILSPPPKPEPQAVAPHRRSARGRRLAMEPAPRPPDDIRLRVAQRLSDYGVAKGPGEAGTLAIGLERNIVRTFKAHWTGFKLAFPKPTMLLTATLGTGEYWSEGFISIHQTSWVLAFRKDPHKARGSGGPRPDDKLSLEASVETSLAYRRLLIESGQIRQEELIRMADYNDPLEAVDDFFNYTNWYVLRAIESSWDHLGYVPDTTIDWGEEEDAVASRPRLEHGLQASDTLSVTLDGSERPVTTASFLYRDGKIYLLYEDERSMAGAATAQGARVAVNWKGRNAGLMDFHAGVRVIGGASGAEFEELARLLATRRSEAGSSIDETVQRWRAQGLVLELTPRQ